MDCYTKKIKEAIFYLYKFKPQYTVFIINLNNGKDEPISMNKKTEIRGQILHFYQPQPISLLTLLWLPSAEEIQVLTCHLLWALQRHSSI